MSDVSLHQFLVLYTWFPLAGLLLFLLLIARIYQKFSEVRTYYWLYVMVMVLFGIWAVRYAGAGIVLGDIASDIIALAAGCLLIVLVIRLHNFMLSQTKKNDE